MRTFDEHWEEIEEGIRWGRIKKAMKALNWKYHGTTGKNITRAELKETARRVCEEAFNGYRCSTGGFTAEYEDDCLRLTFEIDEYYT